MCRSACLPGPRSGRARAGDLGCMFCSELVSLAKGYSRRSVAVEIQRADRPEHTDPGILCRHWRGRGGRSGSEPHSTRRTRTATVDRSMGKASSGKKARRATLRDRPRLIAALRNQHRSLRELGASYDSGWEDSALLLAVVVRVLCHDTSQSTSLLEQLGEKTSMRFKDTAWHSPPGNLLPTNGLVLQQMTAGTGLRHVAPVAMERPFANPELPFGTCLPGLVAAGAEHPPLG